MLHLPTDRLAALADEAPSPDEAAHLAHCAQCAREVRAYESLLATAAAEGETGSGAGHLAMPLTRWDSLSAQLRAEGLMQGTAAAPQAARRRLIPAWATRVAAAAALLIGGLAAGRASAGAPVLAFTDKPAVQQPRPGEKPKPQPPERRGSGSEDMSFASASIDSLIPATFASVEEARLWQQRFENAYQNAAAFIAANDTTGPMPENVGDDRAVRARLAALDRAGRVMREALREAPADPVINGYYLTTLGQREATLRQINVAAPSAQRVIGF